MMGWQWHHLNHMQAICTSLQKITTPAHHQSDFYGPDALPDTQPTVSKHWMLKTQKTNINLNPDLVTLHRMCPAQKSIRHTVTMLGSATRARTRSLSSKPVKAAWTYWIYRQSHCGSRHCKITQAGTGVIRVKITHHNSGNSTGTDSNGNILNWIAVLKT